ASLLCAVASAQRDDAGIVVDDGPPIRGSTIKWVQPKFVDVDFSGSSVVSIGRKKGGDQPQGTHGNTLGTDPGKDAGHDSNRVPTEDKGLKDRQLGPEVPTGVRFEAGGGAAPFEGLMKSQNDVATGNVGHLEIPGSPPTSVDNPMKANGQPLTQLDLMRLG